MDHQFKFGDKVNHYLFNNGLIIHNSDEYVMAAFNNAKLFAYPVKFLKVKTKGSRDISELKPVSDWIEIDWYDESTLPDTTNLVIVGNFDDATYFSVDLFCENGEFYSCEKNVTHWQPLPKMPEVSHD